MRLSFETSKKSVCWVVALVIFSGSIVVDVGNSYEKGGPKRSLYIYELALRLGEYFEFCQEFYWFNTAKLPTPAEYVTKHRTRVKDSVNSVYWFAKDAKKAKANKTIISGYLKNIDRSLNKINRNTVEIHKKFAIPIASIIFLLIGAPLGIKMQRGNMAVSMSISLMFFILYYILIVGGEQLADKNLFNPILSMWLPNLIVLAFGIFILRFKK